MSLAFMACGCGYFGPSQEELAAELSAAEADFVGTWAIAETCNSAWGDGCKTIPESEREPAITFSSDGSCRWASIGTQTYESGFRVVRKENYLTRRTENLLEIGTIENHVTYSFRFEGRDILKMGIVANDASSETLVRFY